MHLENLHSILPSKSNPITETTSNKLEKVNYILKNKIILCTGTANHRKEMLLNTYKNDVNFFPFKKIFFSTCDPENMDVVFGTQVPVYEFIPDLDHHLNSLNCIITSIRNAVNDPEVLDDDIILFKHESRVANDLHLIRKVIGAIAINGYDMVAHDLLEWPTNLYHTGAFFLKVAPARPLFKDHPLLEKYPFPGYFTELYLTRHVFNQLKLIYKVKCPYEAYDTRLGFYHSPGSPEYIPTGGIWDKTDYENLYNDVLL